MGYYNDYPYNTSRSSYYSREDSAQERKIRELRREGYDVDDRGCFDVNNGVNVRYCWVDEYGRVHSEI